MLLPYLPLLTLPVPIFLTLTLSLLIPSALPIPLSVLLLSLRSAVEESAAPHLSYSHALPFSFHQLCLALAILVTVPLPTIRTQRYGWWIPRLLGFVLLLSLAVISSSRAEKVSPSIHGTVSDIDGGIIRGARVLVTNQATETVLKTRTSDSGAYEFRKLPAGIYSISVQAPGFQTFTVYGIDLAIDSDYTRQIEILSGRMTHAALIPKKPQPRTCKLFAHS